jgi:hypothetical protein
MNQGGLRRQSRILWRRTKCLFHPYYPPYDLYGTLWTGDGGC